jgi:hypothetical protein
VAASLIALALVLAAGGLLVAGRAQPRVWASPGVAARALALGLAVAAVALTALGLAGYPLGRGAVTALLAALVAVAAAIGWRSPAAPAAPPLDREEAVPASRLDRWAPAVAGLAFAVFAWKLTRVPVWSWDHLAVWGMKARRFAAGGALDLSLLAGEAERNGNPGYPLGLPLGWVALKLGGVPGETTFKAVQALLGAALLAVLWDASRRLGAPRIAAAAAIALTAASPLLWDTESLGLADLPMAFWAVAAAGAFAAAGATGGTREALVAGALTGFLPWLKQDGLVLALLLVAAAPWLVPAAARRAGGGAVAPGGRRPATTCAVAAAAALPLGLGAVAVGRLLPAGVSFFAGPWQTRMAQRAADPMIVLRPLARELLAAEWLAVWPLFAAGCIAAVLLRRRPALALAAVVIGQLAVYTLVYFGSYLAAEAHISASFFRIAAAQLPLAALALAALAAPPDRPGAGEGAVAR